MWNSYFFPPYSTVNVVSTCAINNAVTKNKLCRSISTSVCRPVNHKSFAGIAKLTLTSRYTFHMIKAFGVTLLVLILILTVSTYKRWEGQPPEVTFSRDFKALGRTPV